MMIRTPVMIALGLLLSTGAAAQGMHRAHTWESPVRGFAEVSYGSYAPNIGSEAFERYFGDTLGAQVEAEYDHYIYRHPLGSLGVSTNVGFASQSVRSFRSGSTTERVADESKLNLMPLRLSMVYRFDYLRSRFGIPVAFSVQPGLSFVHWGVRAAGDRATTAEVVDPASGETTSSATTGEGWTNGLHVAFGAYFLLDFLSPGMGRSFDANAGVNHSYVFVEYLSNQINDFGASDSWDLSNTNRLSGGIAFEF